MRARAFLLSVLLGVALPAGAQPANGDAPLTRDDGIRATLAGRYDVAVRALRPLADANPPDPVAQFFLGLLYNAGSGVKMDHPHACSLFLNAASVANPFQDVASRMARGLQNQAPDQFCPKVWSTQRPATFVLGPNHRVTITATQTSIFLNGSERTVSSWGPSPSIVFEPSVYAFVDAAGPTTGRRHFIESFFWARDPSGKPWILVWMLHEVVGLDYVEREFDVALHEIATSDAPHDVDVSHLIGLRPRGDGGIEFIAGQGPDAKHGTIPSLESK